MWRSNHRAKRNTRNDKQGNLGLHCLYRACGVDLGLSPRQCVNTRTLGKGVPTRRVGVRRQMLSRSAGGRRAAGARGLDRAFFSKPSLFERKGRSRLSPSSHYFDVRVRQVRNSHRFLTSVRVRGNAELSSGLDICGRQIRRRRFWTSGLAKWKLVAFWVFEGLTLLGSTLA